jgi:hypothetical protein
VEEPSTASQADILPASHRTVNQVPNWSASLR